MLKMLECILLPVSTVLLGKAETHAAYIKCHHQDAALICSRDNVQPPPQLTFITSYTPQVRELMDHKIHSVNGDHFKVATVNGKLLVNITEDWLLQECCLLLLSLLIYSNCLQAEQSFHNGNLIEFLLPTVTQGLKHCRFICLNIQTPKPLQQVSWHTLTEEKYRSPTIGQVNSRMMITGQHTWLTGERVNKSNMWFYISVCLGTSQMVLCSLCPPESTREQEMVQFQFSDLFEFNQKSQLSLSCFTGVNT